MDILKILSAHETIFFREVRICLKEASYLENIIILSENFLKVFRISTNNIWCNTT